MSSNKLGSLFSQSSQSNGQNGSDPLKFSAPKEPKKASSSSLESQLEPATIKAPQSKTTATNSSEASNASVSTSAPKLIASATVRLFKLSSTGAYEAAEGGGPVGCVLMNSSATAFNILVYNGQRVTLATSTIVPQFRYNIRDLYFSFTDISTGSSWSILFDQTDIMSTFVRGVATAIAFVCTHIGVDATLSQKVVKLSLPTNKGTTDPSVTLSTSDSAGVYYSAWRVGSADDASSLLEMYKRTPTREVSRSMDFEKIKMSSNPSTAGGGMSSALAEGLLGSCKGERLLLCIPPALLSPGESQGTSWLVIEVEIVKVKLSSSSGSKESSSSASNVKEPSTDPQHSSQSAPGAPPVSPSGDLAARMAALASKGGASKLPTMIPSQQQQQLQQPQQQQPSQQQSTYRQLSPVRTQPLQSQQPQQLQQQQYAVAVVEGQGVRSYYDNPSPQHSQQQLQPHYDSSNQNQVLQSMQGIQSSVQQVSAKLDQVQLQLMATAGATSQYQSTSGSASLQMQQQLQQLSQLVLQSSQQQHHQQSNMPQLSFNPFQQQMTGLTMGNTMQALPYQYQQTQVQPLGQYQQTQVQPLGQYSAGVGTSTLRTKGQDIISLVQNLVTDHENTVTMLNQQHQQQLMQMQSFNQQNSMSTLAQQQNTLGAMTSKENTSKLEEKVESLQTRAEKLMDEKNALLAKQGELLQSSNEIQSKLAQAQAHIDTLQKEKSVLEIESEKLKLENSTLVSNLSTQLGQAADSSVYEARINELLNDISILEKEIITKNAIVEAQESAHKDALLALQKESESSKSVLQSQIADLTTQLEQVLLAREKLYDLLLPTDTNSVKEDGTDKDDHMLVIINNLLSIQASSKESAKDSSKLDQVRVEYEGQLSTIQKQLSQQKESNIALEDDVKSLLQELDQLRSEASASASAGAKGATVSEEALKSLMQAVFVNTVEHFSADNGADKSYTLSQLQKGLRAVLKGITVERLSTSS